MDWVWFILIGMIVGGLSGFFGIGGGVLLVPLLVYLMNFDQKKAQGTSLAVLCLPVVLFAALRYYQKGHVHLPTVGWIILGFVVGSYGAANVVDLVPSAWLQRGFACMLIYIGIAFLIGEEQRSRAVLPAAVATIVVWLATAGWRRRRTRSAAASELEPDYHI